MADLTPRILAGRYEVGELIGRGGMAEVHVGRDTRLGRTVAIKLLRSDLARDPSFQTRFRREAQAAASLNHPAIVSVYDTGEDVATDARGVTHHIPFIIMEYVEGHTLRELMRDGAALPIDEAVDITSGVLSALQYAHHAGIVHRDIKPGNIMLTVAGQVKVMDFGIARALAETSDAVTQTQAVIGTAQYLSPEQARGENVDARSDLYSTGCVLFELLTGRPPFVGDNAVSVAYQHVREQAVPPSVFAPDVPPALDQIVMKALAKNRDQRYSTASEFLADLEAFKRGMAVSAPPVAQTATDVTQVIAPAPLPIPVAASYPPAGGPGGPGGGPGGSSFQNAGILPSSEDVEEDEEAQAKAKRKKRIIIWSIVGGVVALAVILGALLLFNRGETPEAPPQSSPPPTVTVPEVPDSRSVEDAVKALEALKLEAKEGRPENSDTIPKDQVIRFNPASGKDVEEGSTVEYILSLGASSLLVPPTENMTQAEAIEALTKEGLKVSPDTKQDISATVPVDRVIGTDPPVDSQVDSGSTVVLIISNGMTKVPDCTGKTSSECSSLLSDAGLAMGDVVPEESDQPEGTVIRTDPSVGNTVEQKTRVTVVTARAAKTVALPDFKGRTASEARAWLDGAGMTVNEVSEKSATVAEGRVIDTDPPANTQIKEGTTVTLRVSTG
ncbi:MAG: Stk1 family PASTA domain-containing Ser/Thr kinase, partial [Bifidobacteriaceae bacterium]|nr:Stk1 family PASTA domain-containing Ser/Thr kinase [Bifidobacteriaceae bacterium]